MSAIICHHMHGQRVLEESDVSISEKDAFLLGLQGPAVFAYGQLFQKSSSPAISAFCDAVQRMDAGILRDYFTVSCKKEDDITAAYSIGTLCYCCLEEGTTPFVSYGTAMVHQLNPEQDMKDCKNQIESALDIILLRYETGQLPTEFNLKKTVPVNETICACMVALYRQFAVEHLHCTIAEAELEELFWAGIKGIGKLNDKTMLKRQFLKRREKKRGKTGGFSSLFRNISEDEDYDYANVCENEWQWPLDTGAVQTTTYFDLYERAVTQMVRWIQEQYR